MYSPEYFAETDKDKIAELIVAHPFATLLTQSESGLQANNLPVILDKSCDSWILQGHIARANPLWQQHISEPCLIIFQGPQHYISPAWYPSKASSGGKVVPTWNYVTVQVRGALRFIDDSTWLLKHVAELTQIHEQRVFENWSLDDAPTEFLEKMSRAIVGVEVAITNIEGKWKVSQNRTDSDKLAVAAALQKLNNDHASAMSQLVLENLDLESSDLESSDLESSDLENPVSE